MKIKIHGHEIVEADLESVSLVRRGANRAPFKILKADDYQARPYQEDHQEQAPSPTRVNEGAERPVDDLADPSEHERYKPIGREAAVNAGQREDMSFLSGRRGVGSNSLDALEAHAKARQARLRKYES